jgi:hypothetical protein
VIDALPRRHCAAQPFRVLAVARPCIAPRIAVADPFRFVDILLQRMLQRFQCDIALLHAACEPDNQALARFAFEMFNDGGHVVFPRLQKDGYPVAMG